VNSGLCGEKVFMISGYVITILITVAIYAILAHSLNIITGHAGQISLGHAAFFGIGAYTSALLYTEAGLPFWLSVPLAAIAAGIIGALLGIPCLRVRDDFLAITTMGINFVVEAVFLYIPFFGGAMGIGGINLPDWFGREMSKPEYFILILVVFGLLLIVDYQLGRSWIGLAWASIREDEQAAEAMGVDVVRFKVLAFILGSMIAGLAGGFYAHFLTFIMPQNFGFPMSIVILSMVVFGGIGTRWGPLLGALILGVLPELSRPIMEYRTFLYGLLLMFMMRFQPDGLLGSESVLMKGIRRLVPRSSPSR
jgi:branched-chain amino acid transport system permease protein